jgi:hypothetical protein
MGDDIAAGARRQQQQKANSEAATIRFRACMAM